MAAWRPSCSSIRPIQVSSQLVGRNDSQTFVGRRILWQQTLIGGSHRQSNSEHLLVKKTQTLDHSGEIYPIWSEIGLTSTFNGVSAVHASEDSGQ